MSGARAILRAMGLRRRKDETVSGEVAVTIRMVGEARDIPIMYMPAGSSPEDLARAQCWMRALKAACREGRCADD